MSTAYVYVFVRVFGRGPASWHFVATNGNDPLCGAKIKPEQWTLKPVRADREWGSYMCAKCRAQHAKS